MWLRRTKTRSRVHNAPTLKFASPSFNGVHSLLYDGEIGGGGDSPSSPTIYHRNRCAKKLLRSLSNAADREIRIRGAEKSVVVYFTSLRVIRRTFDDCSAVRSILRAFRVPIDERDLSMDSGFMGELRRILGESEKSELTLPRVFTGGRYLGGADEVRRLHESGELKKYLEGLPPADPGTCRACGGYGFRLCQECNGSRKCYRGKLGGFRSCTSCNENGLLRCASCSPAPL